MDLDGTLYEKGSHWSGASASLVKRSVIKISRQGERERKREAWINRCRQWTLCFFPSEYWRVQSITARERRRDEDVGVRGLCVHARRRVCVRVCYRERLHSCGCVWVCVCVSTNSQYTSAFKMCFSNIPNKIQSTTVEQTFPLLHQLLQVFYLTSADTTKSLFPLFAGLNPHHCSQINEALLFCGWIWLAWWVL